MIYIYMCVCISVESLCIFLFLAPPENLKKLHILLILNTFTVQTMCFILVEHNGFDEILYFLCLETILINLLQRIII